MVSSGAQRAFAVPRSLCLRRHLSTSVRLSRPNPSSLRFAPAEALQEDCNAGPAFVDLENAVDLQAKDFRKSSAEYRSHIRAKLAQHDLLHPSPFATSPPSHDRALHESRHEMANMKSLSTRLKTDRHALMDRYRRNHSYLRISLTERCNLRCTYCMPAAGLPLTPSESILTNTEIAHLAKLFVSQGVNKIRLTGGEPTLRQGLRELIQEMNQLRQDGLEKICMTSNGLALHRKLEGLVSSGLTHLNLSLDTLDEQKFERITRRKGHSAVMKSLDTALALLRPPTSSNRQPGLQSVKINNVLTRSTNLSELTDFVRLTQHHPISVRFIEFMPFSGNKWDKDEMVPYDEALGIIKGEFGDDNVVQLQNEDGDGTSKRWKIKGWKGEIGFISSMSDHFCGTCNRLRITADGHLKVCLFDNTEVSLRDVMRNASTSTAALPNHVNEQLLDVISLAVGNKKAKHAASTESCTAQNWKRIIALTLATSRHRKRVYHRSTAHFIPLVLRSSGQQHYQAIRNSPKTISSVRHQHNGSRSQQDDIPTSPILTHLDSSGRASMVSISSKTVTTRRATATGRIYLPPAAYDILARSPESFKKGDVLGTARIAGIMAGKRTSDLIPLCHPIGLTDLKVNFKLEAATRDSPAMPSEGGYVCVRAVAECEGKTGVEMEALTAASSALLTVWDMVKAVAGKEMVIRDLMVTRKEGGKSGDWQRGTCSGATGMDDNYNL